MTRKSQSVKRMKGTEQVSSTPALFGSSFSINLFQVVKKMFFFFRILWKKNEVADYEATTFSIFYNNALFLVLVVGISFYVLRSFTAPLYPFFIKCLLLSCVHLFLFRSKYSEHYPLSNLVN